MLRIEDDMRQDKATTSLPRANKKKKKETLEDVDCEHPLFGRLLCGGGYERDLQMSMSMPFDGKDKDKKSGKKSGGDDRCVRAFAWPLTGSLACVHLPMI